ncbi:MAG: MarR family transcriptional regulator [Bdellovibrionales bacterium]|jgi:hypothetical protein|nr:MarR family transcriptional regulator [Bdellovibrionales bacterium]MBT3526904.1 MarR family transcriptional regulator [Bdellovibrionales bacterium]MBT7669648.1 MarR family transcriptional regulator [Bdellovibrionales bacterium]MBT7767285.1 MarR family transcriptional regulator [Bdellovibrionales bacterium]
MSPLQQLRQCDQFSTDEIAVLADILEHPGSSLGALSKRVVMKAGNVFNILQGLSGKGFIIKKGNGYSPSGHLLTTIRTSKGPEAPQKQSFFDRLISMLH